MTGASGLGFGLYFIFLARISSKDTSSGGCIILEPAPVAVTRGHAFAAGLNILPLNYNSNLN